MSITKIEPNLVNASANFTFNNVTATGNLSSLNANLGNLAQANYFSGSGANLTNLPAGNISGQVGNALISGTVYTASQPNITSVGTLTGLTSTGTINLTGASNVALGPVGNVRITGGSNGQYLQTDGSGILSWSTVASGSTSNISNGNSNVNIPSSNGNVNISAVGNANILVITGTGANITGTLNVTGNTTVGNLTTSGSGGNVSNVNVISANTFIASGNITSGNANLGNVVTANFFIGSGNNLSNIQGANVTGAVSSATTASTVTTASQPNITSVGTLSSLSATGNITSGNANLGNLVTANFFTGNGSLLTGITVSAGNTIVSGNSNVLVAANGNVTTSVAGNANIVIVTGTGVNVAGTLNVTGNATVGNLITAGSGGNISNVNVISANTFIATGNITAGNINTTGSGGNIGNANVISANTFIATGNITVSNANLGNAATANYFIGNLYGTANLATYATTANAVAGGNVSGQVANALVAGTVYTNAQPNITSVGTLTSLGVTGNITSGNANLGNLVTANFFTGNGIYLTGITTAGLSNGNSNVNIPSANGNILVTVAGNANIVSFTGVGLSTGLGSITRPANVSANSPLYAVSNIDAPPISIQNRFATGYSSVDAFNSSNVYMGSFGAANPSATLVPALANMVYLSGSASATGVGLYAVNGNVTLSASSNANIVVVTGTGANITGTANISGNLTAANLGGPLANGNSNVRIATSNGNINLTAVGNTVMVVTGTGANISGTLDVTGNLTAGNIITAGGNVSNVNVISANTFIASGNITGGNANLGNTTTANFFIGSGNNLSNIQGANVTGAVGLATFATTANAIAGANISGQVSNALVSGTVYTNAQPNITSIGSLTGLTVSNASGVVDFTTTANVTLGAIANLHISGGTANYVLNTDGAGNLSWVAPPGGANVTVDNFTGNGVQTIFTLSTTPIGINQTSVNYNGATVLRTDYTLANANITFSSAPENGSLIEVTTINLTSGGGGGGITAQDLLSPFLLMGA